MREPGARDGAGTGRVDDPQLANSGANDPDARRGACSGVQVYIRCSVDCEWDPAKASGNRRKHGVEFADAVGVFEDPMALTLDDDFATERRFVTIGRDTLDRVLVVVWSSNVASVRLISARLATPRERRQFAEDTDA